MYNERTCTRLEVTAQGLNLCYFVLFEPLYRGSQSTLHPPYIIFYMFELFSTELHRISITRLVHLINYDVAVSNMYCCISDYKTDPYSEGQPCNAICCRGDLGEDPAPFGCFDTKVIVYNNNNCKTSIVPISLKSSSSEAQQTKSFG